MYAWSIHVFCVKRIDDRLFEKRIEDRWDGPVITKLIRCLTREYSLTWGAHYYNCLRTRKSIQHVQQHELKYKIIRVLEKKNNGKPDTYAHDHKAQEYSLLRCPSPPLASHETLGVEINQSYRLDFSTLHQKGAWGLASRKWKKKKSFENLTLSFFLLCPHSLVRAPLAVMLTFWSIHSPLSQMHAPSRYFF